MMAVEDVFYAAACRIGNHPFIEFTGVRSTSRPAALPILPALTSPNATLIRASISRFTGTRSTTSTRSLRASSRVVP